MKNGLRRWYSFFFFLLISAGNAGNTVAIFLGISILEVDSLHAITDACQHFVRDSVENIR